ncbi:MAG: hypothetical protein EPO16_07870 [Dehalococcoidia bacterium]|nr:MAG: hypothetical protein EPO16_07870 [Dehalococcoidia bacterium]
MKVQFAVEEVHTMFLSVIDQVVALDLDKKDRAAIRRWVADEMTPGTPAMRRLADKVNEQVQQSHDRSEVSPIKKPDWVD